MSNDTIKQSASENDVEDAESTQGDCKKEAKKRVELPGSKREKKLHSFNFSAGEEAAMLRSCIAAEKFFDKYGKGHEPEGLLMVDRSRYE